VYVHQASENSLPGSRAACPTVLHFVSATCIDFPKIARNSAKKMAAVFFSQLGTGIAVVDCMRAVSLERQSKFQPTTAANGCFWRQGHSGSR
jgi:hypothetical protein